MPCPARLPVLLWLAFSSRRAPVCPGLAAVPRAGRTGTLHRARIFLPTGAKPGTSSGSRPCRALAGRRRWWPAGRVWLTSAVESPAAAVTATCRCARWPSMSATGREVVNAEIFRLQPRARHQSQEQLRLADADRGWRSRLRALRRRRHGGADDRGRDRLEDEVSVRVAAWRGRIADRLRRSADLQLRRQRRGVCRRARQAHGEDALADQPPPAGRSGLHDAARDHGRRSRSDRERRRVSARPRTTRRPARRSGGSATPTGSRTSRGRSSDTGSSTSRPASSSRRSSRSVPTGPAT